MPKGQRNEADRRKANTATFCWRMMAGFEPNLKFPGQIPVELFWIGELVPNIWRPGFEAARKNLPTLLSRIAILECFWSHIRPSLAIC